MNSHLYAVRFFACIFHTGGEKQTHWFKGSEQTGISNGSFRNFLRMSTQITFITNHIVCPQTTICNTPISMKSEVTYLGLHLDQLLTCQAQIKAKCQQLNLKSQKILLTYRPNLPTVSGKQTADLSAKPPNCQRKTNCCCIKPHQNRYGPTVYSCGAVANRLIPKYYKPSNQKLWDCSQTPHGMPTTKHCTPILTSHTSTQ